MNNKLFPVGIFFALLSSCIFSGHHCYCTAKEAIVEDLRQALYLTVIEKQDNIISADTIQAYKELQRTSCGNVLLAVADEKFCQNIKDKRLKSHAYILFDVVGKGPHHEISDERVLCSDTIIINNKKLGENIALRSYASCSIATIFSMSDQRLSFSLGILTMLWGVFSIIYFKRKREELSGAIQFGELKMSLLNGNFFTENQGIIHLTPMQQQLMEMFFKSSDHSLTKEEICAALWPKKDDANDTLYTLIKRLKPIIESNSNLRIVVDRGRSYSLEIIELYV